jgi:DNA-binding GntR family transcriptional regulator
MQSKELVGCRWSKVGEIRGEKIDMAKAGDEDAMGVRHVQPIKTEADINQIRAVLRNKPRDLLLFDLAIQTGLKMKDLLALKVKDLLQLKIGDALPLLEEPTGISHTITMTDNIQRTFHRYIESERLLPTDYLFKSRKGPLPLTLPTISNIIKSWFKAAGIKGAYGAKSLRKTWEYRGKDKPFISRDTEKGALGTGALQPIERLPVQEQIYNKLLDGIVTGRIPPGAKLSTGELSKMFKVSPMPVRVALSRLEARRFIVSQKKKAYFVDRLSLKALEEIISIRLALETLGVKLCCGICSEETVHSLESLIRQYEQADDFDEYQLSNKRFHLTLCQDANMPMLQHMISDFCDRVTPYFVMFAEHADRKAFHQQNITVHRHILEGFKKKDPQMACRWLEQDLKQSLSTIKEMLKQREDERL